MTWRACFLVAGQIVLAVIGVWLFMIAWLILGS